MTAAAKKKRAMAKPVKAWALAWGTEISADSIYVDRALVRFDHQRFPNSRVARVLITEIAK